MTVIGFMHYRKNPEGLNKAYAFAAVAGAEGAELLFFSPGSVDFEKKEINGYVYNNGAWINKLSRFPDVVYNVVGLINEKQNAVADRLKKEIPFTSHSIGDKMTVYKNIEKYKTFSNYLIPSETVSSVGSFFNLLKKYGEIVFKPSSGRRGSHVYYIAAKNESYEILSGGDKTVCSFSEISDFISGKTEREEYLIQPYINCRMKSGNAYDFRLHVQKNINGEWVIAKIYPRIAPAGSIVCNLSCGGYTNDFKTFLIQEFGGEYLNIQKYIEVFSLSFAAHMDKIQNEIYGEDLDELGIDIGLDGNQKINLYEVNWRPGFPPLMTLDLNIIKNIIHYSMFLANKAQTASEKRLNV